MHYTADYLLLTTDAIHSDKVLTTSQPEKLRTLLVSHTREARTVVFSPTDSAVKSPPVQQETWVPSLGRDDPLGKGMATHSSVFAWKTYLMGRGAQQATVHGLAKSHTRLSNWTTTNSINSGYLTKQTNGWWTMSTKH